VASVALGLLAAARREPIGRLEATWLLNGGILALHWVTFFLAIQVSSVATGLLGYATFPLFTLLIERRGRLWMVSAREWVTIALVIAGFVVLVPRLTWSDRTVQGLVLGTVSGVTFAWLALRNRALLSSHGWGSHSGRTPGRPSGSWSSSRRSRRRSRGRPGKRSARS
jgi:drug/metabolite transporter (DMT)-like permease